MHYDQLPSTDRLSLKEQMTIDNVVNALNFMRENDASQAKFINSCLLVESTISL